MSLTLIDWTEAYIKYKDTVQKKIRELHKDTEKKEILVIQKDDISKRYLCVEELINLKKEQIKSTEEVIISCLNQIKNLNYVLENWQELKDTNIVIIFANPQKSMHWTIKPKIHDSVTEKNSLKTGLKSLFETIPEV